jgi:hypothetical protein
MTERQPEKSMNDEEHEPWQLLSLAEARMLGESEMSNRVRRYRVSWRRAPDFIERTTDVSAYTAEDAATQAVIAAGKMSYSDGLRMRESHVAVTDVRPAPGRVSVLSSRITQTCVEHGCQEIPDCRHDARKAEVTEELKDKS